MGTKSPKTIRKDLKPGPGPASSEGTGRLRHAVSLGVLLVCIGAAYANSLGGTWALDDVVANRPVSFNDLRDLIGFRKVAYLSFVLNQQIAPFDPLSFRIVNVLLHAVNAVLVYILAYRTMLLHSMGTHGVAEVSPPGRAAQSAYYTALLSSVIFALHPININAVAYVVQRMTELSAFFVLLTLICYLSATQSAGRVKAVVLYALCACFIVLGIFSKENAVLAVPLILLYDYVFIAPAGGRAFSRRLVAIAGIAVASLAFTSYYLGLQRAAADVASLFMNPDQVITERGWTAVDVHWTTLQHLMTELRVVGRYVVIMAVPLPQLLVFDWWGFPLSRGLTDPVTTLAALFVVAALLVFSVWKLRKLPFLCFGILWYFVALSLESFLGVGSDLYFEHRNYLPVSGLFIGIAGQIVLSFGKGLTDRRVWAAALILCAVLGSLTFIRNAVWKDSITLWRDTAAKTPSNIRAVLSLGNAYYRAMDFENAERAYRQAVSLSSRDRRAGFLNDAAYTLGMMYLFSGKLKEAKVLTDAFEAAVESPRSLILRGFYKALTKDPRGALEDYAAVIGRTGGIDTVVVYTLMGDAHRDLGLFAEALEHYTRALSIDPGFGAAHYGTGASYMGLQDIGRAQESFGKALAIEPDNPLALADMADLMLIRRAPSEALAYAQRAVSRTPPFYRPYLSMANVLVVSGKDGEAEDYYREALSKGMAEYMIPFSKARAYYMRGDLQKMEFHLAQVRKFRDLPEAVRRIVGEGRQGG